MTTLSYTVPVAGSTFNSVADPEVATALTTILTWAAGNIDGTNVAATLTGRRLVSQASVIIGGNVGAFTFFADWGGQSVASGGTPAHATSWAYLDPATFAVTGKSNTQLILRASTSTNATASTVNFTAALTAVTFGGATSGVVTPTAGSNVSGSTLAINTPAASSALVGETTAFTFPAAGAYALTVATSGTTAANSATGIVLQLFVVNS